MPLRDVLHGYGRFDTLRDNLGISEAVLSRRLRAMVEAGLLERVESVSSDDSGRGRPRRGYAGTAAAAELLPILQQLAIWGERHTPMPAGGAHMAMIHATCGNKATQGQICSTCGADLRPEEMIWEKPWRNRWDALVPLGALRDY